MPKNGWSDLKKAKEGKGNLPAGDSKGSAENQNQTHNTKKESLGRNAEPGQKK